MEHKGQVSEFCWLAELDLCSGTVNNYETVLSTLTGTH